MSVDEAADPATSIVPLHPNMTPAKSKSWGCQSCRLYQYAGCFTKTDREAYMATLDPDRRDKKNTSYQMEGQGPTKSGILVILDEPTKADDGEGSITGSSAAYLIRKYAKVAGLDPENWYYTYAVKCHNPDKDGTKLNAAIYCSGFLSDEIRRIQPKTILTFGPLALQLIIGRGDATVSQFSAIPQNVTVAGHTCTVFPMQSPAYIQRNDYLVKKYMAEFDKMAAFLTGKSAVAVDNSKYKVITDVDESISVCHRMIAATEKGLVVDADLETSGLSPYIPGSRISVVSLSCSTKRGYAIICNHDDAPWTDEDRKRFVQEGLKPLMRHPDVKLRWHNGKFDVRWVRQYFGFWPRDQWSDTMLVHYAVDENEEHGLKPLSLRYTDMGDYDAVLDDYLKEQKKHIPDAPRYDLVPIPMLGGYAAMDAVATRKLSVALQQEVERQDDSVHAVANRIMPAISVMMTRLEHVGCNIDVDYGTNFAKPYLVKAANDSYAKILSEPVVRRFIRDREDAARADELAERAAKTKVRVDQGKKPYPYKPLLPPEVKQYSTPFSLNSPNQLQELLYGQRYYAQEALAFSDSGAPSTDKEALTALIARGSPIAKALMEYRLDEKLVSSYIEPILAYCDSQKDTILHPNFKITGTKTARAACVAPNLMATPNKGGSVVKRLFTSRYGDAGCIVQADFSQMELRILACAANDKQMLEAYRAGKDLHLLTACMIFGMTEDEFNAQDEKDRKKNRTIAKRINFGTCLSAGTPILTNRGVVEIENVSKSDLVWDGESWVSHGGVVCNGEREVINVHGVWCTHDHLILTNAGWVLADDVPRVSAYDLTGRYGADGRFYMRDPSGGVAINDCAEGSHVDTVYDIIDCGPNNRFQAGPIIVHNCYGIGAPGIQSSLASDGVQVTEKQAMGYLDRFYEKYPAVTKWIEKVESSTTDDAFSRSLFGRRRRLEQVNSNVSDVVARALRQGVNFVIQSTGADMTWTSMLALDREILTRSGRDMRMHYPTLPRIDVPVDKRWKNVHLILQVHDSIVVDCPVDIAGEVVDLFQRVLPSVIDIAGDIWGEDIYKYLSPMRRLPAACDVEVGPNYRDAHKVKSSKDVDKAMFIGRAKKEKFDANPLYKWVEKDDEDAEALYKERLSK